MSKIVLGVDVGSTTIKLVALDECSNIIYSCYERHHSKINETLIRLLEKFQSDLDVEEVIFNITGSAGLGLSKKYSLNFIQEVSCAYLAVSKQYEGVDVIIELGGEDAKLIFIDNGNVEQRMNGTCAGGTGAFIDQMAQLLKMEPSELNVYAKNSQKIYDISSRCGVFAKNDIQPLLNQGAKKEDIAISVYQAIVNQTIIGLAQGKEIKGKVCFLGGPLTFSDSLRERFIDTLSLTDYFLPEKAEIFVALGCALYKNDNKVVLSRVIDGLNENLSTEGQVYLEPLFESQDKYDEFIVRHSEDVSRQDLESYIGPLYLGIDAGSTTTKFVVLSEDNKLLYEHYTASEGNLLEIVKKQLLNIYRLKNKEAYIKSAFSTGYGEQLIKNSFKLDGGQVETICHFEAARFFMPDVEFILDIGGQDMKYFTVKDNVITTIVLNEACSSGCGSFISTYAQSLGYDVESFSKLALFANNPVDLGTRCTVFMNSGIKQALSMQVEVSDISASLAISVVKNALYKVIRATDFAEQFGTKVLVQGGTFYNDAILKAFEDEVGFNVVRPKISGLMGAFGAALIAKKNVSDKSSIISEDALKNFSYESNNVVCKLCGNKCLLTINTFSNNEKFIANNKCSKPFNKDKNKRELDNMYKYKLNLFQKYIDNQEKYDLQIGVVRALNMYENIPFWIGFFNQLGVQVIVSDATNIKLVKSGQHTIPSDTVCYPAKVVHGHIVNLKNKNIDTIFYPNMPYNEMEVNNLQNHYNCPVVGVYPELIRANFTFDNQVYIAPYISIEDERKFIKIMVKDLAVFKKFTKKQIKVAYRKGQDKLAEYRQDIINKGSSVLDDVIKNNKKAIVLAGRPYHIDPEVNHGIDTLITDLGCVVLSEDCFPLRDNVVNVLNQWTYHNRMYNAAYHILDYDHINLVQLVSFGCGIDSITSDEVKRIIESNNKIYTQIKIDDITNTGSASIRLRSLINIME